MTFIPLSVPSIQGKEWKYIKECLDTEWVSSAGKYVDIFEQREVMVPQVRSSQTEMSESEMSRQISQVKTESNQGSGRGTPSGFTFGSDEDR